MEKVRSRAIIPQVNNFDCMLRMLKIGYRKAQVANYTKTYLPN